MFQARLNSIMCSRRLSHRVSVWRPGLYYTTPVVASTYNSNDVFHSSNVSYMHSSIHACVAHPMCFHRRLGSWLSQHNSSSNVSDASASSPLNLTAVSHDTVAPLLSGLNRRFTNTLSTPPQRKDRPRPIAQNSKKTKEDANDLDLYQVPRIGSDILQVLARKHGIIQSLRPPRCQELWAGKFVTAGSRYMVYRVIYVRYALFAVLL